MIETEHVTQVEHVSEVVHIKPPWFFTWMACLAGVLLAATLFFFALGQWQGGRAASKSADDARHSAQEASIKAQDLKMKVDKLTAQIECRSQRGSDLNAITSDMIGELVNMVNLLSDQPPRQPPEAFAPIKQRLKDLADQRAAAKEAAVTAVQDC